MQEQFLAFELLSLRSFVFSFRGIPWFLFNECMPSWRGATFATDPRRSFLHESPTWLGSAGRHGALEAEALRKPRQVAGSTSLSGSKFNGGASRRFFGVSRFHLGQAMLGFRFFEPQPYGSMKKTAWLPGKSASVKRSVGLGSDGYGVAVVLALVLSHRFLRCHCFGLGKSQSFQVASYGGRSSFSCQVVQSAAQTCGFVAKIVSFLWLPLNSTAAQMLFPSLGGTGAAQRRPGSAIGMPPKPCSAWRVCQRLRVCVAFLPAFSPGRLQGSLKDLHCATS